MEEIRLPLLILGIIAIIAVTTHGLWTIRKNSRKKAARAAVINATRDTSEREDYSPQDGFDELGIGPVTVIRTDPVFTDPVSQPDELESEPDAAQGDPDIQVNPEPVFRAEPAAKLSSAPMASDWQDEDIPEPPSSLLKKTVSEPQPLPAEPVAEKPEPVMKPASFTEKAIKLVSREKAPAAKARREPKVAEDQMRMDFADDDSVAEVAQAAPVADKARPVSAEEQQVLILNVKMPDGKQMSGAALLPVLLTLGFKFGAQDIFHRHVNSNGKGPVLFSLANMFKPGVFDVDNMEHFNTPGVSLFMMLPIEGDPHQVFNMMHNAAKKIADEFGAQILDGRRSVLTKQGLQQYIEKIRESERRRMINR